MEYGIKTEIGFLQQFSEYTENTGGVKPLKFKSAAEAMNMAREMNLEPHSFTIEELPENE